MPRKPGNISPEGSGRGSMPLGSSSQGAMAAANQRAGAGAKAFQLYQGKNVRIGTFDNITSAKARAQGLIDRFGSKGPDFRVVDPMTGKTILRIK